MSVININIDELNLHGFSAYEGKVVAETVKAELSQLIEQHGMPESFNSDSKMSAITARPFHQLPGMSMKTVSRNIASSIYQGLQQQRLTR